MPNVTPVQSDFSVGEVAPDLQMRSTLDAQRRGVKTLTNFVADARGPVIRRKGFRFLGKIGDPSILASACPTETSWVYNAEGQGTNTSDRVGARVKIASDGESMVTASFSDENLVHVFERYLVGGTTYGWRERSAVAEAPEDPIQAGGQSFGTDIAVCESLGVLAVGSPSADISGIALQGGAIDIYTGNNVDGWTWENRVVTPNLSNSYYLGSGVALSKDGSTLISTMPGTSGFNTYEVGPAYVYSFQFFTGYPSATTYSGSPNGVVLSNDGKVAFIGDVDFGVGASGRVLVYDRSGSSWVLRQEIPRPEYAVIGAPGTTPLSNVHKFGQGVATTEDLKDLLVTIPLYADDGITSNGMICFYRLNEETNLYEFCSYITGDKDPGWANDVDLLFDASLKRLYTGTTDYPDGTGFGVGTVYEYNGVPIV